MRTLLTSKHEHDQNDDDDDYDEDEDEGDERIEAEEKEGKTKRKKEAEEKVEEGDGGGVKTNDCSRTRDAATTTTLRPAIVRGAEWGGGGCPIATANRWHKPGSTWRDRHRHRGVQSRAGQRG